MTQALTFPNFKISLYGLLQLPRIYCVFFLGLWRDDFYGDEPDVLEAMKRVSQNVIDERNFRIVRATQLDAQKKILPKEQWTKFEEVSKFLLPLFIIQHAYYDRNVNFIYLQKLFMFCRMYYISRHIYRMLEENVKRGRNGNDHRENKT